MARTRLAGAAQVWAGGWPTQRAGQGQIAAMDCRTGPRLGRQTWLWPERTRLNRPPVIAGWHGLRGRERRIRRAGDVPFSTGARSGTADNPSGRLGSIADRRARNSLPPCRPYWPFRTWPSSVAKLPALATPRPAALTRLAPTPVVASVPVRHRVRPAPLDGAKMARHLDMPTAAPILAQTSGFAPCRNAGEGTPKPACIPATGGNDNPAAL